MGANQKLQQSEAHHQAVMRPVCRQDGTREGVFGDLRFRALLPETDWQKLPAAIQQRFTKRLAEGETVLYRGRVTKTRLTRMGWVVAQLCRLIGAPLPYTKNTKGTAVVAVTEDRRAGGQLWTRLYTRDGKFPHVVHSAKRFCGPTGLEEYVGHGVGMALTIHVIRQALVFRSVHYFVELFGGRFRLPRLLSPGRMEIVHAEAEGGKFSFTLSLTHPWLGPLVHQVAYFEEV
ncbi:hypothetical protein MnTg02_00758 [bacterium MnTg02]|nr:hypothetical protein MnTg02_00758 [bacterium MnTg02]